MNHLTSDELIDAMEGGLAAGPRAHLDACDACRRQLDELAAVLTDAKQASVPEPSPWFWNHFAARVNEGIDREAAASWPQWLRWQVLLPLGAVAMVILALMVAVPKQGPVEPTRADAVAPVVAEDTWASFADLVGELDVDVAAEAGVIQPGLADEAVWHLTAEEQQELSRLLQAELTRAKS
jgi:hypothetical protein